MITAIRTRYALHSSQPLAELTETRHGGKWRPELTHSKHLNDLGILQLDGLDLSIIDLVREYHRGALVIGEMVEAYRRGEISAEYPVSNWGIVKDWSDQWDQPNHIYGTISKLTFEGALKWFSVNGIPSWAHASTSNSLIDASSEAAMRAHPDDPKQKQLANPDWFKLPVKDDVVLLGEDGTGMDLMARSDHVALTGYDAEIAAKRKAGEGTTAAEQAKQQFIDMATRRHNERIAA